MRCSLDSAAWLLNRTKQEPQLFPCGGKGKELSVLLIRGTLHTTSALVLCMCCMCAAYTGRLACMRFPDGKAMQNDRS